VRTDIVLWSEVRRRVLTKELSQRAACKEYGLGWHILKKILAHDELPGDFEGSRDVTRDAHRKPPFRACAASAA
jgi:hypothetical protein